MSRISRLKGTPYEIGLAMGQALGSRLAENITRYIHQRIPAEVPFKVQPWRRGALPWLRELPDRFLREFEGLAAGSGLPLQRLAEWAYLEALLNNLCSGAIVTIGGHAWVARNNDMYAPDMWGFVTIREVTGRIPHICFGLEGDVFTPTGVNRERLWLHYNWLPAWDAPEIGEFQLPAYAFMVEALETCRTLLDVEKLLLHLPRAGGMLLFAVDGKTDEFALYECTCRGYYKRQPAAGWIAGANHYCALSNGSGESDAPPLSSPSRLRRLETLAAGLDIQGERSPVSHLIQLLGDDEIEARSGEVQTAYSNVACPAIGEIWYTFGGYPSASQGDWGRLEWPWDD
jgi:hypothetical protein